MPWKAQTSRLLLALFVFAALGSCVQQPVTHVPDTESEHFVEVQVTVDDEPTDAQQETTADDEPASQEPAVVVDDQEPIQHEAPAWAQWIPDTAPEYYEVQGKAKIEDIPEAGSVNYAPLDELGRTGQASANITYELMEAGRARERANISSLVPSGWGYNDEVDIKLANGTVYHGLFWNRSHLIAKSLGGADIIENLVCGTRMQNVGSNVQGASGGMAYCESLARDWLDAHHDGTVAYVATPIYEGDELVCRSVIVDVRSSDGQVDAHIEVFNTAYGYKIDYATGEFWPES